MNDKRETGTVLWFNKNSKRGRIKRDNGKEITVFATGIGDGVGNRTLNKGDRVSFLIKTLKRRSWATNTVVEE